MRSKSLRKVRQGVPSLQQIVLAPNTLPRDRHRRQSLKRLLIRSAMASDSFPHLVPLSALEHSLHRALYPFDFLDGLDPFPTLDPPLMSQPPPSPQASTASPSVPSDAAERSQSDNPSPPSAAPSSSEDPAPGHRCQWISCDKVLPDPEALYNHLCNDHIGRKSTGNLCLTCKWKDCGTTCAKRDHITSHLRGMSTFPFALVLLAGSHSGYSAHTP